MPVSNATYIFAINLFQYGFTLILPAISLIGFVLNCICFIVFSNRNLKEKIHFYLMIKSFIQTILQAIFVFIPYDSCYDCASFKTFGAMVFSLWINKYLRHSLYLFDSIVEIVITFNRYYIIKSSESILVNRNDKIFVFICGIICLIVYIPNLFAYEIVLYEIKGKKLFFLEKKFWPLILDYFFSYFTVLVNISTILILTPANIAVLIQFKIFMKKKNKMRITNVIVPTVQQFHPRTKKENAQSKFTKMILIVSFLFILGRLGEIVPNIFYYVFERNELSWYADFIIKSSIVNIFVQYNSCIIFSINFFIYYSFNKPFKNYFLKIFFCKKIPQN